MFRRVLVAMVFVSFWLSPLACGPAEWSAELPRDSGPEGPVDDDGGALPPGADGDAGMGDGADADEVGGGDGGSDAADADVFETCSAQPPLVGLMHTAEQLQYIRDHRSVEPWASAIAQVMGEADAALGHSPQPVTDLDVPAYYEDADGHEEMKRILTEDGFAAYALALAYQLAESNEERDRYADQAIVILHAWASINNRTSGPDGALVMMYRGVHLVYAADLVGRYESADATWLTDFRWWVDHVIREGSREEKEDANNHGDWGTLGAVVAAAFLEEPGNVEAEAFRICDRIFESIDDNGELPLENLRTNSGIWYTYFALAAMTVAIHVVRNTIGMDILDPSAPARQEMRNALDSLFFYSLYPDQWPYELPAGPEGWLHQMLYPCADELEVGAPSSWPGNLFEIMSAEYDVAEWAEWVEPYRPIRGWQGWIYPTLMRQ
jgi:hypothetical protein